MLSSMLGSILGSILGSVLVLSLLGAGAAACRREKPAEPPPPVAATPPPPPPPCDVVGSWQAQPALPLGPQQIDVVATDKPGVFLVRAKNGADMGVASIKTSSNVPVDTAITNPVYKCSVGADCNTMTCGFMGGAAPATFKRL